MDKAKRGGFLTGFKLRGRGGEEVKIAHLLVANDTLVFCKNSSDQLVHLSWILMLFEAFSGLKINLGKSAIFLVERVENPKILALELGCEVDSLPKAYLGLPLGANHNPQRVWDGVEERFKKRLALWKRPYISKGGRLTLIRSTLSNMSIYLMSLFRLPKGVKKRLERIQRDFLWGDRKVHLINWKTVCLSKEKGGLGIRGLLNLNRALLGKWSWRFATDENALWKDFIKIKHGTAEGGVDHWSSKWQLWGRPLEGN